MFSILLLLLNVGRNCVLDLLVLFISRSINNCAIVYFRTNYRDLYRLSIHFRSYPKFLLCKIFIYLLLILWMYFLKISDGVSKFIKWWSKDNPKNLWWFAWIPSWFPSFREMFLTLVWFFGKISIHVFSTENSQPFELLHSCILHNDMIW